MPNALAEDRRRARIGLLEEHLRAENLHDLDAIMETFGAGARLILNGYAFADPDGIRALHRDFGFAEDGGFSDLRVDERRRYISDDAVIMEQTLSGKHTGTWQGIEATRREFKIPVCTVYTFDEEDKLAGENVYFDRALLLKQLGVLS
ncbi:MAG TPA: ester cyclase [Pyrinomonadaceae bacterium]|nr:ester cyclase [Pyrinomonadaceae bacterium]